MARFTITATVSVDVEMSVEAASATEARKLFDDHICMTATLIDLPEENFDVSEECVSGVDRCSVRREAA